MKKLNLSFIPIAILIFCSSTLGITSEELAQQVEKKYKSLLDLSMDFTKSMKSEIFEDQRKIKGKMYYFGSDKTTALQKYLDQATYLHVVIGMQNSHGGVEKIGI